MRAAVVAVLIVLAGGAVPRGQSPPAPPAIHSQTIHIDVIASDPRGRVLDNLRAGDFSLVEDGKAQPLDDVRFVRPGADEARVFGLYLDEYHVSADSAPSIRSALSAFVEDGLRPQDVLVVMKPLDSIVSIMPVADRAAALDLIRGVEGRSGDYAPRNAYERNFMAGDPARIEQARAQVALSAINAIAVHFARYPSQRKTLIVVSDGLGRGERRRGLEYLPTADTIIRSAQQANVAVYAISARSRPADGDVLPGIATETMGLASFGDVEAGLRRALQDAAAYYLLTYRVQRPEDGHFHPVQVAVKRPGAVIRARKGYFAPSPDAALGAELLARLNHPRPAPPLEPAPHASTLIRAWFGTSRGAGGKTRITFVWEPAARPTGERNRRTPTRVVLTALAPDDSVLFQGVVLPTAPGLVDEAGAMPSRAVFEMMPGRLRLRMSIQDAAQQALDTDIRSISVRDMRTGVTIATPEVLRARNAREFRSLEREAAIPAAAREFSRAERLLIRFAAYDGDTAPVTVSARLLSRMGPMRDLPISTHAGRHEIDLPLAGLATGEYIVELSATGTGGEAKDVVTFRVTT
jgi:VWFA-related protein